MTLPIILLRGIRHLLSEAGGSSATVTHLSIGVYIVLVLLTGFLIARMIRGVFRVLFQRLIHSREITLLSQLNKHRAFHRLTTLIPPLWVGLMLPVVFTQDDGILLLFEKSVWISFCIALTITVNSILSSIQETLMTHATMHDRPIKGFIQLIQVGLCFLLAVIILSILFNRSPLHLLTGLSAFAAVLMLVFRDTILGFVSGVLLAQNDMVRMGDWIQLQGKPVNGIVIDLSLTTVKVRNFDHTIATIPPYDLVSNVFINWRGMRESEGRLIYQTVYLKASSVKGAPEGTANKQPSTNLELYRDYLTGYLTHHPQILQTPVPLVYLGTNEPYGVPVRIFCYTPKKERNAYMQLQSEVTEHAMAVLSNFSLESSSYSTFTSSESPYITSTLTCN